MGGGVNGAGIDEVSDELRLVSCDELPSVVGETRVGSRTDVNDEASLPLLSLPVASMSASRLGGGGGVVMLGSGVRCRPLLAGGGVSGAGKDEVSDELWLVSYDELPSTVGGTRIGWF